MSIGDAIWLGLLSFFVLLWIWSVELRLDAIGDIFKEAERRSAAPDSAAKEKKNDSDSDNNCKSLLCVFMRSNEGVTMIEIFKWVIGWGIGHIVDGILFDGPPEGAMGGGGGGGIDSPQYPCHACVVHR